MLTPKTDPKRPVKKTGHEFQVYSTTGLEKRCVAARVTKEIENKIE